MKGALVFLAGGLTFLAAVAMGVLGPDPLSGGEEGALIVMGIAGLLTGIAGLEMMERDP